MVNYSACLCCNDIPWKVAQTREKKTNILLLLYGLIKISKKILLYLQRHEEPRSVALLNDIDFIFSLGAYIA